MTALLPVYVECMVSTRDREVIVAENETGRKAAVRLDSSLRRRASANVGAR